MEKKSIGSFLTVLRKANGLTQKQLAEKLNVSDKAVSRWERDECAPDLSLIPVLAEIYQVTSDEILQGHRMDPEKLSHESDRSKAVKQRNRILKSAKTKYISRSVITLAVTLAGVILAYTLNFEFSKANAGFLVGSVFFLAATVCQSLILMSSFATLTNEDWQDCAVEQCKGFMFLNSEWCLGVIAAAISLCIPLAGKSQMAFADCIFAAIQWLFIITTFFVGLCIAVNFMLTKKGTVNLKQPVNKLCLHSGTVLACILVLLLGLQAGMNGYLTTHRHLYAPYDTPISLPSFKTLMEEPISPEGEYMYEDQSGEVISCYIPNYLNTLYGVSAEPVYRFHENEITKKLLPTDKNPGEGDNPFSEEFGYQFRHLNLYIPYYEISDQPDLLPIYTFNVHQLEEANNTVLSINAVYLLTYMIAAVICCGIYKHKKKKV